MQKAKVPVTILSGQLGSGKSTLLRRILTSQTQYKIAVVMNEFSQTAAIEGKAMQMTSVQEGTEIQEWIELDNGCLCCSAQDQGVRAIESLMDRRSSFDYIIIETSGVADPSQVATLFWLDSGLDSSLYLDGIVTVIDCVNLEKQLQEEISEASGTTTKQIAVADSLYLSKTDLVDDCASAYAQRQVQHFNPGAPMTDSREPLETILSRILRLDAFSAFGQIPHSLTNPKDQKNSLAVPPDVSKRLAPQVGQLSSPNFRPTHDGISALSISLPILIKVDGESQFDITFRKLIWEGTIGDQNLQSINDDGQEPVILRAKGLLKDTNGKWHVLQGVRDTYEIQEISDTSEGTPRLVLIGRGLNEQIKQKFLNEITKPR